MRGFSLHSYFVPLVGCDSERDKLDVLAREYLKKAPGQSAYMCTICAKSCKDLHAGRNHLESKHFPSQYGYNCQLCGKHCKTKNALACHYSFYHRNVDKGAESILPI